MRVRFRWILISAAFLLTCGFLICSGASATVTPVSSAPDDAVKITDVPTVIGENFVRYPQLEGMQNTEAQALINNEIVEEARIAQRLITLATLQQGGTGLQVSYASFLKNALFSTVVSAKGMMENRRSGHQYTALSYDLTTGNRLQLSDLFADPESAIAWMEEQLLDDADDLSLYLENADVTPLPVESFALDAYGITFYYPYDQFALLSGYSGAAQFQYGELQEFLIRDVNAIPDRLGALLPEYTDAEIKERIETVVSEGTLPYLPVSLGDSLPELIAQYLLVRTPDQYPGGRYFQLEAPAFRQVSVLSDALTQGYDHSVVEGILATRMNLYGLQTGIATRARWHQVLGEPATSVQLDASLAADYGFPPGTADYYAIAGRQLMLYADENDVLYAVRLTK